MQKGKGFITNIFSIPILVVALIFLTTFIIFLIRFSSPAHTASATVSGSPDCTTLKGICTNTTLNFTTPDNNSVVYTVPSFYTSQTLTSGATLDIVYELSVLPSEKNLAFGWSIGIIVVSAIIALTAIILMFVMRTKVKNLFPHTL